VSGPLTVFVCQQEDRMADPNPSRTVAAELTRGLTRDDLDALRRKAGLEPLPEGSLSDALLEHGFSVEDLVTLLMAALIEKNNDALEKAREIERLSGLVRDQTKAIDLIADQTARLKTVLLALDPKHRSMSAMERLKALVDSPDRRTD
jgi:hypothetical protein